MCPKGREGGEAAGEWVFVVSREGWSGRAGTRGDRMRSGGPGGHGMEFRAEESGRGEACSKLLP